MLRYDTRDHQHPHSGGILNKQIDRPALQAEAPQKYEVSRRKAIILLVVLTLLYMLAYMDRSVIAVVMEQIKIELGLTDAQTGMFQSVFMLGVGVLMIPCGMAVDRWSRRKAISVMAVVWSGATMFTGAMSTFFLILVGRFVTSAGEAGFAPGGTAWLSLTFRKEVRAKILGVFNLGVPFGGAMGVVLGGAIVAASGSWRTPFFVFAIPGILLGMVVLFMPDYVTAKTEPGKSGSGQIKSDLIEMLQIRSLIFAAIGTACITFLAFVLTGWLPTLFMRVHHLDPAKAGMYTGLAYILSMVGTIIGGILSDAWQKRNPRGQYLFTICSAVMATIMLTIASLNFDRSPGIAVVLCAGFFFFGNTAAPSFSFITQDVVPPKLRATAFALCGTVIMVIAALGPVVSGKVSDMVGGGGEGLVTSLLYLAPVGALGVTSHLIGIRSYLKDREGITDDVLTEQ